MSNLYAQDYFPFGSVMDGRSYNNEKYRFGFNGKEEDTEGMGGGGSTYDYGFRIYNPSLGKFLSLDPLTHSYPWYTPYQFAGNMPIVAIDLDGLEEYVVIKEYYSDGKSISKITIVSITDLDDIAQNMELSEPGEDPAYAHDVLEVKINSKGEVISKVNTRDKLNKQEKRIRRLFNRKSKGKKKKLNYTTGDGTHTSKQFDSKKYEQNVAVVSYSLIKKKNYNANLLSFALIGTTKRIAGVWAGKTNAKNGLVDFKKLPKSIQKMAKKLDEDKTIKTININLKMYVGKAVDGDGVKNAKNGLEYTSEQLKSYFKKKGFTGRVNINAKVKKSDTKHGGTTDIILK